MIKIKKMILAMTGATNPYLKRIGLKISRLLNTLLGGDSNQTFSARNYNWYVYDYYNLVWLIDYIFGKGHCMRSWDIEIKRRYSNEKQSSKTNPKS